MLPYVCSVTDYKLNDKNKHVAHKAIAKCVTDVLTTFWRRSVISYWTDAHQHGISLFYIITEQNTADKAYFNLKSRKPAFTHFGEHEKKNHLTWSLSVQSKAISLVANMAKNCDRSKKIKPLSNLTRGLLLKSRIKMLYLSTQHPSELKNLDIALIIMLNHNIKVYKNPELFAFRAYKLYFACETARKNTSIQVLQCISHSTTEYLKSLSRQNEEVYRGSGLWSFYSLELYGSCTTSVWISSSTWLTNAHSQKYYIDAMWVPHGATGR